MACNDIILLVEDSEFEAKLSTIALQNFNKEIEIVHLCNGKDVIDYLACINSYKNRNIEDNLNVKFILMDINMPKMTGIQALESIKNNLLLKNIPVIMLSSSDSVSDILKSYQLGANSYIKKPIDFEEFKNSMLNTVQYWLNVNHPAVSNIT
jgi:CheY-like chemotaxis protein